MFSRKRFKGKDFAEALVYKVAKGIYGDWNGIASTIKDMVQKVVKGTEKFEVPESHAPFVIVAVVVADLQAIRNLRGQCEYMIMRKHVSDVFSKVVDVDAVQELISYYESEFFKAIERGEDPVTYGICAVLYEFLEIRKSKFEDGSEFQNSFVLFCLSTILLSHVGFTKFALENYEVVAE